MIVFPNAKINLGLNILHKRDDGYHELETCFYPVKWQEALEINPSEKTIITTSGIPIPNDGDNIILKAYKLLLADFSLPPVKIHLHKAIPIGAGLGGGSADAAFAVKLMNDEFSLGLTEFKMIDYVSQLGADCSFFIKNKPCLASGIGEKLVGIDLSLKGNFILMIYPNIHISTKEAYSNIKPQLPSISIEEILNQYDLRDWKNYLINDFERPLFKTYPVLQEIKSGLYDAGANYASMSGSGSCMFGIFDQKPDIDYPEEYTIWMGNL